MTSNRIALALPIILALSACTGPKGFAPERPTVEAYSGVTVDAFSTTIGIASGRMIELDPIIEICGPNPVAMGLCVLGGGYVLREGLVSIGLPRKQVAKYQNAIGWGAAANNVAIMLGATSPAAPIIGLFGAVAWLIHEAEKDAEGGAL